MSNENVLAELNEYAKMELDDSFDLEQLESKLEEELALEFNDLQFLQEEKEKIGNPDSMGKVILDEVWKQFSNQIGLELTSDTLIQEYDRTHPDESSVYNQKEANKILQDEKYKDARKEMKMRQEQGTLNDDYTGKVIKPGEKFDVEHVVARKEIFDNLRRKQAGLEAAELANKDENMKAVNDSLNRSIKEKPIEEYVTEREQREKDLIAQNERAKKKIDNSDISNVEKRLAKEEADRRLQKKLDANDELMLDADKKARKAINKEIAKGVVKQTAKKAGKDALKQMAVTALFALLKEVINGLVRFFKSKSKSFQAFLDEMKQAIKSFFEKIVSVLQTGASSVIGTILSEIFGPIVGLFKKLSSLIKQGVSSVMDAVKYLNDKKNRNEPISIKVAQVGKIITTGLVAGGAIFLGELFEKLLLSVPGMQIQLPLLGTLANVIGMFLASLVSGIVGAVVINLIDKFIAKKQKSDAQAATIDKGNEILILQHKVQVVNEIKLEETKIRSASNIVENHRIAEQVMKESLSNITSNCRRNETIEETFSSIDDLLKNLEDDLK